MSTQTAARILLVEDEPKLRRTVAEGLCYEDWDVTSAATGFQAQELLNSESFDAIVLDWMLPDRDGLEIVRQLRAQGNTVPIVIISARGGATAAAEIENAGANDYLPKPFSFDDLLAHVQVMLKHRGNPP